MDTIYKTYTRFLAAAKKFPRWSNTRRRPVESNGGKLLRSIVEEIGAVEDAIIEYKKDFFIVNYIGKEESILAYIYAAYVGPITDFENFKLTDPKIDIITDKEKFYNNLEKYAYYQDGYIVLSENNAVGGYVIYNYNDYIYRTKLERVTLWNIFDEFALWVGLERYDNESNKELMQRTVNIFRYRPNSTEQGIKNVIYNTVSNYGNLDMNEIIIEQPNEENMSLLNDNNISLYEEISRFNHDIARTKQWDCDYWDNSFRKLGYLPHVWDAPVERYKDGVGYNDSLKTDIVKNLDTDFKIDVKIHGYKKSKTKVQQYIRDNNLTKELELELKRYTDEINPIQVQYKITATTLTEIQYPKELFVETYKETEKSDNYHLQDLALNTEDLTVIENNKLSSNKKYTLELWPKNNTFLCEECYIIHDNDKRLDLMSSKDDFEVKTSAGGKVLTNKTQSFYGDQVSDFNTFPGFINSDNGFKIEDNANALFTLNTTGMTNEAQKLHLNFDCKSYNINENSEYITLKDFEYDKDKAQFISSNDGTVDSEINIEFSGNYCSFVIPKPLSAMKSSSVTVSVYLDEEYSNEYSPGLVHIENKDYKFELQTTDYCKIKIVIKRTSTTVIAVQDIQIKRYKITVLRDDRIIAAENFNTYHLSRYVAGPQSLAVQVENYGNTEFEFHNIIIGSELTDSNAVYKIDIDTTGLKSPRIFVKHNGDIKIYNEEDTLSYYNIYQNNTSENKAVFLDLSGFVEIKNSVPEIKYDNLGQPFVNIAPGQSVSTIKISGKYSKLLTRTTLADILKLDIGDTVYVNKKIKDIIVKTSAGEERFCTLDYNSLISTKVNKCKIYSNKDKNLAVVFVVNKANSVESITNEYEGLFDYAYIYSKNSKEHVAYNRQNIVRNTTKDIYIENNFLPSLTAKDKVLYFIEDVTSASGYKFNVLFADGKHFSTTSSKSIIIEADNLINNSDVIKAETRTLKENFTISNTIPLNSIYSVNEEELELSKYIMTVPDNMTLHTVPVKFTQYNNDDGTTLFVENDGFNKLAYANISKIEAVYIDGSSVPISPDNYRLMNEEGIICWENEDYYGHQFVAVYTYEKPSYLSFNGLDFLYDIAGYDIDALTEVTRNEYIVKNLGDGEGFYLDYTYFTAQPDKVSIICSDPCYMAVLENNYVTIKKIADDNSIAVHNGYYYIDGAEFWHFSDKKTIEKERLNGLYLFNVIKVNDSLVLQKEASNFLMNSKMHCNTLAVHAMFDFNYYRIIPNISTLEHIGACDSLSSWNLFRMKAELNDTYDGNTIVFSAEDKNAYAILDITKALRNGKIISCWYMGDLKFSLGKEKYILGQGLSKSMYVEEYEPFELYSSYAYFDVSKLDLEDCRYYIIVTGSGSLIESIISNSSVNEIADDYSKAISKFGLNIKETVAESSNIEVDFTPVGMVFDQLEMDKNLFIQTGTTADWGITKIKEYDLEKEISPIRWIYRQNSLIATADNARLETKSLKLDFKNSIENLVLKINDYAYNDLKQFVISVLGSNSGIGNYIELANTKYSNILTVPADKLTNYVKFVIEADENKIINHLEVFAQYKESETQALRIMDHSDGYAISKIYDVGAVGRYVLEAIDSNEVSPENITYYVRGIRTGNDNVYTDWYEYGNNHVFDGYKYFQFKVELKTSAAKTKINKFIFKSI